MQLVAPSLRNVPHNPLQTWSQTRPDAAIFAFVVMIAGGVREEIQRGFVLRRFEQYSGRRRGRTRALQRRSSGWAIWNRDATWRWRPACSAPFWGVVFLRRRSIVGPMVGHAGFNLAQVFKFLDARRARDQIA